MANRRPKKEPTEQPSKEFFGQYWNALVEGHKSDRLSLQPVLNTGFNALRMGYEIGRSKGRADLKTALNAPIIKRAPDYMPKGPRISAYVIDGADSGAGTFWDTVEDWWMVRLLKRAADSGDTEGFKRLLHYFLLNLHIVTPKGVLMPFRWENGRPRERVPMMVEAAWIELGRKEPNAVLLSKVAQKCYPDEWRSGDDAIRRKLRKRVLAVIRRHQAVNDTKRHTVS
jgi:hypothetical protein